MRFPLIRDIATQNVVSIGVDSLVSQAIEMMLKHEHRNIVVVDGDRYRILAVLDILSMQADKVDFDTSIKELDLPFIPSISKDKNVLDTLEFLNDTIEYICAVSSDNSLYGLVTHTDITSNIDPDTLMDTYTLQDFLKLGRRMKWVGKDEKTCTILKQMIESAFDNVVVVEDFKPIGILTTKDVVRLIKNRDDLDLPVYEFMSKPIDTINKSSSIKDALAFIKEKHYKRVIVVDDDGSLSGVIAQKELISLTYSRWATLMKEYHDELHDINTMLQSKNREYETMASTDSLTGLYNRYKFLELYLSAYTTMVQRGNDMSLIMLDIDHFKNVNDNYGHNIGDQVLIQVSHALLKTLRNVDIVCRWGGEEFIVLLPTANMENALHIAEKLRQNIEELDIDIVGHITASFGVAEVIESEDMDDVVGRADKALSLAKNSGRNCVKTEYDV